MKKTILEKADELIQTGQSLNVNTIETFVHETLKFFEELRTILINGSPEEKKEALEVSRQLQEKLQSYAQNAYAAMGKTPEEANNLLQARNFSDNEWNTFQNIQKEIDDYKHTVIDPLHPSTATKAPKKPELPRSEWRQKI